MNFVWWRLRSHTLFVNNKNLLKSVKQYIGVKLDINETQNIITIRIFYNFFSHLHNKKIKYFTKCIMYW